MELEHYIKKYKLDISEFAYKCGVPYPTMRTYIKKKHKPSQKVAEIIEKISDNLVTVKELRGKDDREKRRAKQEAELN